MFRLVRRGWLLQFPIDPISSYKAHLCIPGFCRIRRVEADESLGGHHGAAATRYPLSTSGEGGAEEPAFLRLTAASGPPPRAQLLTAQEGVATEHASGRVVQQKPTVGLEREVPRQREDRVNVPSGNYSAVVHWLHFRIGWRRGRDSLGKWKEERASESSPRHPCPDDR